MQVYETVETMLLNPEEVLKMMKHTEESTATTDESKRRFKRLSHIFGGKDNHKLFTRPVWKHQINDEEKPIRQSFPSFFDRKSSLFLKKPFKYGNSSPVDTLPSMEDDWTLV